MRITQLIRAGQYSTTWIFDATGSKKIIEPRIKMRGVEIKLFWVDQATYTRGYISSAVHRTWFELSPRRPGRVEPERHLKLALFLTKSEGRDIGL